MVMAIFTCPQFLTRAEEAKRPKVTRQEKEEALESARRNHVRLVIRNIERIQTTGLHILRAVTSRWSPAEQKARYPNYGVAAADTKTIKGVAEVFKIADKSHPFVLAVPETSPAQKAGLNQGDILLDFRSVKQVYERLSKSPETAEPIALNIRRGDQKLIVRVEPEFLAMDVQFTYQDDQVLNAVTFPTSATRPREQGRIQMYGGMMKLLQNDNELAVVLGHEVAHLTRGHLRMSKLMLRNALALGGLAVPGWGALAGQAVGTAVGARFSREDERSADYWGLLYAHAAGYDPAGGVVVWERMLSEAPSSKKGNLWSSHPTSPERMALAKKVADEIKAGQPPEPPPESAKNPEPKH
jgi:hypothetical protein